MYIAFIPSRSQKLVSQTTVNQVTVCIFFLTTLKLAKAKQGISKLSEAPGREHLGFVIRDKKIRDIM